MSDASGYVSSLLIKPTSARCNLRCDYCFFYRDKDPYLDKDQRKMSDEVAEEMIRQHLETSGDNAVFCWQGGEPTLMGLDFYHRVVEMQKKHGRPGQQVGNVFQTNGILLDQEWMDLFNEYRFFVGLSLDGPEHVHNRHRKYANGKGTHPEVMKTFHLLKKSGVEFNILCVMGRDAEKDVKEVYRFFDKLNHPFVQLIPCVSQDENGKPMPYSITPEGFAEFMCEFFDLWYNNGNPKLSIRMFDDMLGMYMGMGAMTCEQRKFCGDYLVVEHNGDIYPCDFIVEKEWHLGNLFETPLPEILNTKRFREFRALKPKIDERCKKCQDLPFCHGGCLRYRHDGQKPYHGPNLYCDAFKKLFRHVETRMYKLAEKIRAEQSRAPARF